uniref:Protein EMBRYONIC FLOWER 1-like n=1 Tax=Rhizophora mucronata TaxID=61149 RepID=A0A2P2KCK0_RHIMU
MEGGIALEENGNNIITSKSMESIKIDSISIDLIDANEKRGADICDHFTIRGYVSETRKRDWNLSLPFASDGGKNDCEGQKCPLPPLHVPKFKFWRCHNCLSKIDAKDTANDIAHILKSCHPEFNSNNVCSHMPVLTDVATKLSNFQPASKLDVLDDVIKIDANTSANLYKTTEVHPSLFLDKKENRSEVANKSTIVHNMQLEENVNQEIQRLNCVGIEAVSGAAQKTKHMDDMVAFQSKCNGCTNLYKPDGQHLEVAGSEFPKNLNGMVKGTNAISHTRKETSLKDQNKELIPCGRSQEASNAEEVLSADKGCIDRFTSLESKDCNASSSESAEIVIGNDLQDLQDDDSSGLHRRKARKVRLLTELLFKHGDRVTDNVRTEDYASNTIPAASCGSLDASTGVIKPPVTQHQLANQGTARKSLSLNRKRKLPQDEEWRPPETSSPNKFPKEVRDLKGDSENTNAVVQSESEALASARISLQTDLKHHWSKHKIDKISTESKKKNKKTMTFYESLSSLPLDKNVPIETGDKSRDDNKGTGIDGVFLKPMDNSFTGREMDLFPLTAQSTERNLGFSKKEGKMPQDDDQQASIVPWNHSRPSEGPMTRKDLETISSAPIDIPFNAVGETSHENGLNLSLNSCMATGRYDGKYIPQAEDRQTSFLACQNTTFGDQVMRKAVETKYIGDFGFTSNSAANAPFKNGLDGNLSSKRPTYTATFTSEKQNHTSQVKFRGTPYMQQKDFYSTDSRGKSVGSWEHSTATMKDNGQKFDKLSEQGALDDIPMDIVELMAKNQYERCLPDADFNTLQLATTDNPKWGRTTDCSNTHGLGELSLFQQETTRKQKHEARNGRNGTIKRADILGTTKEKTPDYFSQVDQNRFNIGKLEQTHIPAGFRAPFELRDIHLNGLQHFASSSRGQSNAQNCQWIGDISGKRFNHNILQASRTCDTCQHNPRQNKEASHILSSMMPNHVPSVYSIPQKVEAPPANLDMLSCTSRHCSVHEGKMNRDNDLRFLQSAANTEMQPRNFSPDTLSTTRAEYLFPCTHNKTKLSQQPVGSLDLCSNETIPAMHLLSLVDAGIRSTAPVNMEVSAEFFKRPPINHDPIPKQFSRLVPVTYKASNRMKDPPCHGKYQVPGKSHGSIRAIPTTVGVSSSSSQIDNSFKEASDFTAQLSREMEERKGSDVCFQNKGRSQKSVSANVGFGSTCGSIPVHSMQTIFSGARDPRMFPLQFHAFDNSTKHRIQATSTCVTVQPHKNRPETQICNINRNPSDFGIPDDENEYMIQGKDLKIRGGILDTAGCNVVRLDGHKRQRKCPTAKEGGI